MLVVHRAKGERKREIEIEREREGVEREGDKERARNFLARYIENKTLSSGSKLMEVPR